MQDLSGYHQCWSWDDGRRCQRFVPYATNFCTVHAAIRKWPERTPTALELAVASLDAVDDINLNTIVPTDDDLYTSVGVGDFDTLSENINLVGTVYKGGYMALTDVHFKFTVHGNRNDIDMFYAILKKVDSDFPLDPFRSRKAEVKCCKKCTGYLWSRCAIDPPQVKRAAKQAGIKVKIRVWVLGEKCKGEMAGRVVV